MNVQNEFRDHFRSVTLTAVSIIASLLIYLTIAEFIRARFKPFHGFAAVADVQTLRYAFFAGAIASIVLIRILRQALMRKAPPGDVTAAVHRLQRAALVTLVLAEVPGVLGLILFLLRGLNVDFYILLFASLLLVFMYFPRRSSWEDWLRS